MEDPDRLIITFNDGSLFTGLGGQQVSKNPISRLLYSQIKVSEGSSNSFGQI